jgi:hypothetical protein
VGADITPSTEEAHLATSNETKYYHFNTWIYGLARSYPPHLVIRRISDAHSTRVACISG